MNGARRLFTPLLAVLAYVLLRALHATLRCDVRGELPGAGDAPVVFAFWHGEQQLILPLCRRRRVAVLTSRSADGRLQAAILRCFGLTSEAGSSSRGGAAGLRGLVRQVRAGRHAALAVDGPRGPRHAAKAGALQLARLTGARVVPLRAVVSRGWHLRRTWDGFVIPKPFARIELHVGEVLEVPRALARDRLEVLAGELTRRLGGDDGPERVRKS